MTITQDDPRTKPTAARRVEIFTGAGRRRSWSVEEKAGIIAESMAEGASVSAVARTHGLTPAQIFRWRRSGAPSKAAPPPALSFAPVLVEAKATTPAASEVIEIELKGAKLRVPAGTRPATIVVLVKALRSSR
jgi:transposase